MRAAVLLSVTLLCALSGSGCGTCPGTDIEGVGNYALTPEGRGAVLRVTVPPDPFSGTGLTSWGRIATADLAEDFGERLACIASDAGGLDVMPQAQWERLLNEADLQPTLQPTDKQLRRHADALGLSYYLTAHVHDSELRYVFFWSWAVVNYELACHAAGDGQMLWQVSVQYRQRYASDREAIVEALERTFRRLSEHPNLEARPP